MRIDRYHEKIITILLRELRKNRLEIIAHTSKDTGIREKWLEIEFRDALFALRYLPLQAKKVLREKRVYVPHYSKRGFIDFTPKGKVLQVLPSSTPILSCILLPFCASLPGNTVTVKPSSRATYLSKFIQKILRLNRYKYIHFKIGKGKKFLYSLVDTANFVFYMGSERIGKSIEIFCCGRSIEFSGEYEGNDWAVVLGGDIKAVCEKICANVLFKEGRDCDSIKGILVKNKLYEKVKKGLKLKLGGLLNDNPSINEITRPKFSSNLWIRKIGTERELLELTKINEHSLSMSIFHKRVKRALDLAKRVNFARIIINSDTLDIHPLIPWGGIKKTGYGGVDYWVLKFINKKIIEIK